MSNFDIKRFVKVAQWTLKMNFKGVLSYAAGLSFAYLFILFTWLFPILKGSKDVSAELLIHTVSICSITYLFIVIASGTWIFANMQTKAQRTTMKLLPALRILTCLVVGVDYVTFSLPYFLQMVFTNADITGNLTSAGSTYPTAVNFVAAGWCFWAQSLYILGGTALRRYQFAITSTVHAALFIAMTVVVAYGNGNVEATVMDEGLAPTFYTIGAVLFGIAVLNWWFSYRIFKRMQVINNKWINL